MTDFAARVDAFFDEYFALDPPDATAAGDHAHDGRVAGHVRRRPGRPARVLRRWTRDVRGVRRRRPRRSTSGSIATCSSASSPRIASTSASSREDAWSPIAWVYLIGDGLLRADRPRVRAARRAAGVGRGAAEGLPGGPRRRPRRLVGVAGDRPVDRFHTEKALEQWPGIDRARRRGARRRASGRGSRRRGRRRGPAPAARGARRRRAAALDGVRAPPPRRSSCRRATGEGRLGPRAVRREDGPHDADSDD